MVSQLQFTRFVLLSLLLHAMGVVAVYYLNLNSAPIFPAVTPVQIVELPKQEARALPPLRQQVPPPTRPLPERRLPPSEVPMPKKFGTSDDVVLPKTAPPSGMPEGAGRGEPKENMGEKTGESPARSWRGPLPFLTQNDIDEMARRGMPARKPGDDSVTLDTSEFKFISYNRWLKIKVESVLKYPELAAISGYQGTLYIQFEIMKDGSLGNLELLKSSGYKILDDEALRAIRGAAPFQPLPDEWGMEKYSIRAAVLFYLHEVYVR